MDPSPAPGGSPEAQIFSQFIADWERQYAERIRAKLQDCDEKKVSMRLSSRLAECMDIHLRMVENGYAKS